jgi:hypothetical protein
VATIDDALKLVRKDPVGVFVGIAIASAQPPSPGVVVKLKGRTLLLPDWTGDEWLWYCKLASRFAAATDEKNASGETDKSRQLGNLTPHMVKMRQLGTSKPTPGDAAACYTQAVKLVIATNAASTGPTAGDLAFDSFKAGILEAPATVLNALKFTLEGGLSNMTKVQREAARIIGQIFIEPVKALTGGLLAGLGPTGILVLAVGAYYLFGRKQRS